VKLIITLEMSKGVMKEEGFFYITAELTEGTEDLFNSPLDIKKQTLYVMLILISIPDL
jgi:hypothetical protein